MIREKIGFGIIGLGNVAKTQAYALEHSAYCYLAAVYSPSMEKGMYYSEQYRCRHYTDLSAFLSDRSVSVVVISTPSGLHRDIALECLRAGKHILVEKPLEITVERGEEIVREGKRRGLLVGGIFQNRFYDAAMKIRTAIDSGRFVRIVMLEASCKWLRDQNYYDSGAWRGTKEIDGGGCLMNQAIHAVDLLQWFGGDVVSVSGSIATTAHERIDVEDNGAAVVDFRSGAVGIINASTSIYPGFSRRIEILGTEGSAVMEDEALTVWKFRSETEEDERIREKYSFIQSSGASSSATDLNYIGHMRQFDDFSSAVTGDGKLLVDGEEALKAVRIIRGIYRSAEEGRRITL